MTDASPRDLIKRMADELDHYRRLLMDDRRETHVLATEARAYLAQSEPDDSSLAQAFIAWILFDPDGKLRPEAQEVLAACGIAQPEPTLTVEDCKDMSKHWDNFIAEDCPGEIILDGCFTREDLIEIANTVPTTEA